MTSLALKKSESSGVVYSDPSRPSYSVRFKNAASGKQINGLSVQNTVTEIIANDSVDVTVGGSSGVDNISIRIRTSGSSLSQARVAAILADLAAKLPTWTTEHVFIGFNPATPPAVV